MVLKFRPETHRGLRLLAINKDTTVQDIISDAADRIVAREAEKAGAAK